MAIKPAQYAQALEKLAAEQPKDIAGTVKSFLGLLQKKGEMKQLGKIVAALEDREASREGKEHFIIEIAHALDHATKKAIETFLKREFPKKTITTEYHGNPELIAGFRAHSKETLLDQSLRAELAQLETHIRNA